MQHTTTTATATTPVTSTPAPAPKQVVLGFIAALNDRSGQDWERYLAADVIDHNKIIFGEEETPGAAIEGFRQQLAAFSTEAPGDGFHAEQLIAEGDEVVARLRVCGVHTGYHPRMPEPTGRRCDVEQIWIFTVRAGRIAEIRAVSDRLGMFLQLGWDWPSED
ncbi:MULTISPECIES: ester cyclase [unclassified Streptomyces]|uniref:ester cyclase n=1 Tax=unclassified Streptomyces TaxID=2593676 RepID=UPI000368E1BD|nr:MULTISPECIES: ester cyclase [unclassified Streptomyces]MYX28709.1 ester cyclase [Streptomyces sp. SID8381]